MTRELPESVVRGHDFHGFDRPYPGAMDQKVKRETRYQVRRPPCVSMIMRLGVEESFSPTAVVIFS